jgi:hypothetical protein
MVTTRRDSLVLSGPTYTLPLTSEMPSATSTRRSRSLRCGVRSAAASSNLKPAYAPSSTSPR